MTKDEYEAKQEEKRERYEARAAKAQSESEAQFESSHNSIAGIPMGQPILVGHHSERRHRAALNRSDRAMRKSIDAQSKAEHYARKAAGVGNAGISSDDPGAGEKLEAKIAELEEQRAAMKAFNKKARKEGTETLESWQLSNLGANIRRYKQRLDATKRAEAEPAREAIEGEGFTVEECKEDNRIRMIFEGKPPAEVRTLLKRNGFRWSPRNGAWQRQLNNAGRYAAGFVAKQLAK